MSEDKNVELGTVLELTEAGTKNVIVPVAKDEEGTEYVSLDELYETTGQESIAILGENCKAWGEAQRLSPSGFKVLKMAGFENMFPGYDKMNFIKGSESWLDTLKKGFIYIVKAVKKFIIAVVDWVVLKVKTIAGFGKTTKELEIVAEISDDVKIELNRLLKTVAGSENIDFDSVEFYSALPGSLSTRDAFTIIQSKNKNAIEQLESIVSAEKELSNAEEIIYKTANLARESKSRYSAAVSKLKKSLNSNDLSNADILDFRHAIDKEIIETLDYAIIKETISSIMDKIYGIDLGRIGIDSAFKDSLKKQREELSKVSPVVVSEEQYDKYRKFSKQYRKIILKASTDRFDQESLKYIKDVVNVQDGELIDKINQLFPTAGVLTTSYTNYCAVISQYTMMLEALVTIVGNVKKTMASVINWANKVDKLVVGYIVNDLNTIAQIENEILPKEEVDRLSIFDENGNRTGSIMDVNYDNLYVSKHSVMGPLVLTYRAAVKTKVNAAAPIIKKINGELKGMGINKGIKF